MGSVILYGCETWTLKPTLQKSLDGGYTRLLCAVLNIDKKEVDDAVPATNVQPLFLLEVALLDRIDPR